MFTIHDFKYALLCGVAAAAAVMLVYLLAPLTNMPEANISSLATIVRFSAIAALLVFVLGALERTALNNGMTRMDIYGPWGAGTVVGVVIFSMVAFRLQGQPPLIGIFLCVVAGGVVAVLALAGKVIHTAVKESSQGASPRLS